MLTICSRRDFYTNKSIFFLQLPKLWHHSNVIGQLQFWSQYYTKNCFPMFLCVLNVYYHWKGLYIADYLVLKCLYDPAYIRCIHYDRSRPFERLKISLYKRDVLFVAISAASVAFQKDIFNVNENFTCACLCVYVIMGKMWYNIFSRSCQRCSFECTTQSQYVIGAQQTSKWKKLQLV